MRHVKDAAKAELDQATGDVQCAHADVREQPIVAIATVGGSGAVLLAGNFESSIDLGAGAMVAAGGQDIFISTLAP